MSEDKSKKKNQQQKISFRQMIAAVKTKRILATYQVGALGAAGFTNFTRGMRQIYFIQIMGLSNAQYATSTVVGNIVNGITNPVMGFLMDKRIFKRKYSPWVLIGAVGSVMSYVILYFIPWTPLLGNTTVAWLSAMFMVVLVGLFFAITNLNRGCIFSDLTMDGRERIIARILSGWVNAVGRVGGTMIFPIVFTYFTKTVGDNKAYFTTVIVLGAIYLVFAYINSREIRLFIPADTEGLCINEETGKHEAEDRIPAKDMLKNLLTNYPLFALVVVLALNMTQRSFSSALPNIYYKYVAGDLRWLTVFAGLNAMAQPVIKIIVPVIGIAVGDPKWLQVFARTGAALTNLCISIFGKNIWAFMGLRVGIQFWNQMASLTTQILKTGAVDYGEWKNGIRHPGMVMALSGMGSNAGQAIGVVIRAWLLENAGFKPGFVPDEQFKGKLLKGWSVAAAITGVQVLLLIFFYPMDKKKLEELKVKIEEQRALKEAEKTTKKEE